MHVAGLDSPSFLPLVTAHPTPPKAKALSAADKPILSHYPQINKAFVTSYCQFCVPNSSADDDNRSLYQNHIHPIMYVVVLVKCTFCRFKKKTCMYITRSLPLYFKANNNVSVAAARQIYSVVAWWVWGESWVAS
jgi:hypothetical protein